MANCCFSSGIKPCSPSRSKSELENGFELDNSRRGVAPQERAVDAGGRTGRADNGSKGWRRIVEVGILEVGVVQDVIALSANLQFPGFQTRYFKALHYRQVRVEVSGASELVSSLSTERGGVGEISACGP